MKSMRILLIIIIISCEILGFGVYAQNPAIILDPTINYQTITPAIDSFSYIGNGEMISVNPPQSIYYGTSISVDNEGTQGFSPEDALPVPQNAMNGYSITFPLSLPDLSLPIPSIISPSGPLLISEIPLSPETHLITPMSPDHQGVIIPAIVSPGAIITDLSSQDPVYHEKIGVWFAAGISEAEGRNIISALDPEFRSTVENSRDRYIVVPRSDYGRVIGLLRNESGVSLYDPNEPGSRIKEIGGQVIVLFSIQGDADLTMYRLQEAGLVIQTPLVMTVDLSGQNGPDYYYTTMDRLYQDEHVLKVTASSSAC
jgi:hypothetical protein